MFVLCFGAVGVNGLVDHHDAAPESMVNWSMSSCVCFLGGFAFVFSSFCVCVLMQYQSSAISTNANWCSKRVHGHLTHVCMCLVFVFVIVL